MLFSRVSTLLSGLLNDLQETPKAFNKVTKAAPFLLLIRNSVILMQYILTEEYSTFNSMRNDRPSKNNYF